MKWGVVVFPGSNCDRDAEDALGRILQQPVRFVWHRDRDLEGLDGIVLPGGFSYGDYLRSGAIAGLSPVMEEVVAFADRGGTVIGICNGFQVLTETGLLPGALRRNTGLRFICEDRPLRVEHNNSRFTGRCETGEVLNIPVAHNEGNYYATESELDELEAHNQVLFRYCTPGGEVTEDANPNGSTRNIAGIMNRSGNVLGMMPHPERRCDPLLAHEDGRKVLESVIRWFETQ
ncbi:phosphoribosylformylglycinamidine synthase subunit PurQ [bacterium]|nr:phosphoribosylformylglycinamidine synthase subunit PurQ [bacterium]